MIRASRADHEAAINLFQQNDARHQMCERQIRKLPAHIRALRECFPGTKRARDDKNKPLGSLCPLLQMAGEFFAGPHFSVQIEQNNKIPAPYLLKRALRLAVFDKLAFCRAVRMCFGVVFDFGDVCFGEGLQPLNIFVLQGLQRFIFEFADGKNRYCHFAPRAVVIMPRENYNGVRTKMLPRSDAARVAFISGFGKGRPDEMKMERPDYYSKFTCIADKCGDTCCRGWEVDIDDDANEYYQIAPGEFAKEVRESIREEETEDGPARFFPLTAEGNCPFLDKTGLCRIILHMGEGALCTTCREYPRYYIEAGDYSQQDLSLSCPAVAKIFFAEDGRIAYTLTEDGEPEDAGLFDEDGSDDNAGNSFCACDGSGDSDCGGDCGGELTEEAKQRLLAILAARDQRVEEIQSKPFAWELAAPQVLASQRSLALPQDLDASRGLALSQDLAAPQGLAASRGMDAPQGLAAPRGLTAPQGRCAVEADAALLSALQRCEPIGAGWSEQLLALQQLMQEKPRLDALTGDFIASVGEKAQNWFRRLQVYFIWRYSIDAWFEERETAEALCRRSLRTVFLLCLLRFEKDRRFETDDMADIAHIYSREIEHDEKNLEIMKGVSC